MKLLKANVLVVLAALGLAAAFYGTSGVLIEVASAIQARYGQIALWAYVVAAGLLVTFVALYADAWTNSDE